MDLLQNIASIGAVFKVFETLIGGVTDIITSFVSLRVLSSGSGLLSK